MRTQNFRTAGLLIAAALLLGGCRPKPSATIVPDPALMPLVPADATILAGIRVAELKKTPVYQKLMAENKLPQVEEFAHETGIDPRKDIWDIVVASNGKTAVTLVRGQFTEGGIAGSGMEPQLDKKGIKRYNYRGYTFAGDDRVAVTFLNSSVAVAGAIDEVKKVIDARDGSKGKAPQGLIDRVKQLSSSNQIWLVSSAGWQGAMPAEMKGPLAGLRLNSMPVDVRSFAATLDLSNGVKFSSAVASSDEASAKKLNDAVRGLIGIGRLTTSDGQPEILKFYDTVQVVAEKETVRVSADVPMDLFEKFLAGFKNPRVAPLNPTPR